MPNAREEIINKYVKMSDAATSWVFKEDAIKAMDEYMR
jgi:hypothetical protein